MVPLLSFDLKMKNALFKGVLCYNIFMELSLDGLVTSLREGVTLMVDWKDLFTFGLFIMALITLMIELLK